jgi:hypothetical protein
VSRLRASLTAWPTKKWGARSHRRRSGSLRVRAALARNVFRTVRFCVQSCKAHMRLPGDSSTGLDLSEKKVATKDSARSLLSGTHMLVLILTLSLLLLLLLCACVSSFMCEQDRLPFLARNSFTHCVELCCL